MLFYIEEAWEENDAGAVLKNVQPRTAEGYKNSTGHLSLPPTVENSGQKKFKVLRIYNSGPSGIKKECAFYLYVIPEGSAVYCGEPTASGRL